MPTIYDFIRNLPAGYAYRYDARPPTEILKRGFEGTNSHDHAILTFENRTIFASRTAAGAFSFRESALNVGIHLDYLYRINITGLRCLDFCKSYYSRRDALLNAITDMSFNQKIEYYSSSKKYRNMGHRAFFLYLKERIDARLRAAFLQVDEIHIQGPIEPLRIRPTTAHFELERQSKV
ncbi:MAG: hypothetical protein KF792_06160 [Chelatococcus sp.]|nr:hypothetical protein [Chelatococcus sp. YT9]MBX3555817.1 hypothetical protein [Chelatococcus sp.]